MGDQISNQRSGPGNLEISLDSQPDGVPFHAQLGNLGQAQYAPYQGDASLQAFDVRQMGNALPQVHDQQQDLRRPPMQYGTARFPHVAGTASMQYMQQVPQLIPQRHDPATFAKPPQGQYFPQHYGPQQAQYPSSHRQHPAQIQTQQPFAYGIQQQHGYSPVDMRFPQQGYAGGYGMSAQYPEIAAYARRTSQPTIPLSSPRGPPRKPKQSGHALWVGNLPPVATVSDLKDHFSKDATKDIESLFLISKSNCAFVNYRSEVACANAMHRFHDSRFQGVRLVCRLRRGSTSSTEPSTPREASMPATAQSPVTDGAGPDDASEPTIVGIPSQAGSTLSTISTSPKVPERFFIVKSLTLQDLEASVRNGIWATQSHNEKALNTAFEESENVYLIFSANKSGEYFGYARMESPISGDPVPISTSSVQQAPAPIEGPQSIPTPATETAPRGRIIDDSARGTIFWEAELSDEEGDTSPAKESAEGGSQDLGRPFRIAWLSTARVPFYRTRGLRNPLNANREVKIARDGTELEPSIGKRLVQMFHRPMQGQPPMGPVGLYNMA